MINIKRYFKYIGLISICLLSFYYTEQVSLYVKNKNPIMQSIKNVSKSYYTESINCSIIEDTYIIPGFNGKYVNEDASFYNMVTTDYKEELLVFNQIKPKISIEDNKDKIIIRGNHNKNAVSLLFEEDNKLSKHLDSQGYKINILNNNTISKNYCYTSNDTIPKQCKNKYTFTHSIVVNHSNLSTTKNKISSGDIILIKDSLSILELDLLINQINYQDLSIIPIQELLSEYN